MTADSPTFLRAAEQKAFEQCAASLRLAQAAGPRSPQAVEALRLVDRLWTLLLEDLSESSNRLPDELKAGLISIGIWALRRVEALRQERSTDFSALIEVSEVISKGLGSRPDDHSP